MGDTFYERLAFSLNGKHFLVFMQINPLTHPPLSFGTSGRAGLTGGLPPPPENVFNRAARGSNPGRFSSYVLLCLSHLVRASGDGEETTTTTTRFRRPGVPCHHRAQGSSVNPFGYPPLSDVCKLSSRHTFFPNILLWGGTQSLGAIG